MPRRLALWVSAVSCAAALSIACGGGSSSLGSQLSPSGVTLTSLAVTLNPPPVGSGTQATATATFSNGSTSPVASGFTSDSPSVATVTGSGVVTGVSIGDVTISVDYQGMRASKKVRVLPGYGGLFIGSYTVNGCTATGSYVSTDPTLDLCTTFVNGAVGGIAFLAPQSADLTSLTAQFQIGAAPIGSGTGTISPAGVMTFTGAIVAGSERMDFRNFSATSSAVGRIGGSFLMDFTDTAPPGTATVTAINMDMTRQGSAASLASVASQPADRGSLKALILRGLSRR
jgi:hypothetical protein